MDVRALLDMQPEALRAFIRARSPAEAEATLAAHPGLLAGDYDASLDLVTDAARIQSAARAESALRQRKQLLNQLRHGTGADVAQQLGRVALLADRTVDSPAAVLAAWEQFTKAPSFAAVPLEVRALAHNRLGIAHSRHGEDHESAALRAFEAAVREAGVAGVPAVEYRCNLLTVRLTRAERSKRPALDALLAEAKEIVAEARSDPGHRAVALAQLAVTHNLRFRLTGWAAELDAAISAMEEALHLPGDDAERRSEHVALHHGIAKAAYERYMAEGQLGFLDRAVTTAEAALRATPPNTDEYAARASDFGMLLRQRYEDRGDAGDLWKAVSALRSAVGRTAKSHPEWSGRAINLGNALTQLYEVTNQAESLDEAVDLLEEAVRRASAPSERSLRLSALSRSLRVRHEARGDRADLERSVELDAEALSATPPGNSNGMLLLNNLANGLSLLSDGRDQQWKRAVEAWREVCRYGTPAVALMAALTWLDRALTRDVPEDGTDAADLAQVALDRLVSVQEHRREQENWLRMADHLPAMAAQVNVAVGNPEHAVLAVERSRASLFTKQLLGSTTSDLTFAQLQGFASAQAPLAYLVPGDHPLALIVDSAGVSVVDLPELTENAVQQALSRFYWGYYHREADRERWPRAFDEVTRWLWAAAMEPLLAALPGYPEVQLLPGGQLALLPLHAAWEVDSSRPTGRRYACDEVVITLLPNAQLPLQHTTPPRTTRGRLLTVADPQPTSERSLRLAVTEAHGASVAFDHVEHLAQKDATPQRVLAAARTADVLHFACHGRMKMDDPRASGLILADDQVLTVGAVLDAHLDARLIVASACESGFVAPQLPNEVVSLAAALLFAGARAVLATAFTVDDLSALLLTSRFYAEWGPDTPGPQAVQKATRFLRDTTNAEKLAWVEHLHRSGWPPVVTEALRGVLGFTNPDERSFASPVQWAAFTWWGQHVAP